MNRVATIALAIAVSFLVAQMAVAQQSLSGFWQTTAKNNLYLRELPNGLEINGKPHILGEPEEGEHIGSSARYTASLMRIPNGYRLTTRTLQTWLAEDRHIESGFLTEEDEYRISADGLYLMVTIITDHSREAKRSGQSLTYRRISAP